MSTQTVEAVESREVRSFLEELTDFIEEEEIQELELDQDELIIKDTRQAEYFLKKVKELQREKEEIEQTAQFAIEEYQKKVEKWKKQKLSPIENTIEYFSNLLDSFARYKLEGSSKKSLKLIEGTIGYRSQAPKYNYEDEKALVEFLEKNAPDFLRYKKEPDKSQLKKQAEVVDGKLYIDDKLVEGITVEERGDAFYVK